MYDDNLTGKLLIAGKWLRDFNFYKTVVLLVEHGDEGAMGLVVNRPSSVSVSMALSGHFNLPDSDDVVHVGGPVEPAALFIMHNSADLDEDNSPLIPGLFVGSSADVFENVVQQAFDGHHDIKYRIFSGCAGWSPGQLEEEINRGDWYVSPANAELIYWNNPYQIWEEALQYYTRQTHPWINGGNPPEWN